MAYRYEIKHCPGIHNLLADAMSRWCNSGRIQSKAITRSQRRLENVPLPEEHVRPDRDVKADDIVLAEVDQFPDLSDVVKAQAKYGIQSEGATCRRTTEGQVWQLEGRIVIPEEAHSLKRRIFAAAHQYISGHHNLEVTLKNIRSVCTWKNLYNDVKRFQDSCLACLKGRAGQRIPRPVGSLLQSNRPFGLISCDYLYIGASRTGDKYVCLIKCQFSRLCCAIATKDATATSAIKLLMQWISQKGLPDYFQTDGGAHFKNHLLKTLLQTLKVKHHVTACYNAQSNGSVEVANKSLLRTFRQILKYLKEPLQDWPKYLPLVVYVVNMTPQSDWKGKTPLEVATGLKHPQPLQLALSEGHYADNANVKVMKAEDINSRVAEFATSVRLLHNDIIRLTDEQKRKRRKARAKSYKVALPILNIGDYVLVIQPTKRRQKLLYQYAGPYIVVGVSSGHLYQVRLMGDTNGKVQDCHVSRILRYASKSFGQELKPEQYAALIADATHDIEAFRVEKFLACQFDDDEHKWKLYTKWKGFTDNDNTWEPVTSMHEDIPAMVLKYFRMKKYSDKQIAEMLKDNPRAMEH